MKNFSIRTIVLAAAITPFIFSLAGCSKSSDDDDSDILGDWSRASDFEGVARTEAVSFTIGNNAYVGSGYDGANWLADYWSLDPATGTWTQKADMPGAARSSATAFAVSDKGYVGTGYDGLNKLKDFYEYDPAANTWTRKADLPASARYEATGFAISAKGYITCGFDGNYLKDLWEYDPSTDIWTQKASVGGTKRSAAQFFVIDNFAYVFGGINNNDYPTDFWMYDASANSWTQKRAISNISSDTYDDDYTDIARSNGTTFTLNNKGYLVGGERSGALTSVWQYNPGDDTWQAKTALEASGRSGAVGFTVEGAGYITTGSNSSYRFDDLWKFNPDVEQVDNN
ncbi:MAG: kelch repeat-containing protein [Bacteroidota bacterium]